MASRYYIPISSVKDIDLTKISYNNINNRYVDKEGKRWATRFNLRNRRIEIVRVALGQDEAVRAKHERRSTIQTPATADAAPLEPEAEPEVSATPAPIDGSMPMPSWVGSEKINPATANIELKTILTEVEVEAKKFTERMRGIIQNIKNAGAFEVKDEMGRDFIMEVTAAYDREIQEPLGDVQNYVGEFIRFPKPASTYFTFVGRKQKSFVEKLSSDDQMIYFQAYLTGQPYLQALGASLKLVDKISEMTKSINTGKFAPDKRLAVEDVANTLSFLRESIREETGKITGWMKKARVF